MADVELADSLYDDSLEVVGTQSPGATPYKIRVSNALQNAVADHEDRLDVLEAGGGTGDVVGPGSSTDNAVARFDSTSGKLIQNSVVTIADSTGNMAGVGTLNTRTITNWVDGPASATDNAIVRFDGTSGKLTQNSAVTVADTTGSISNTAGSGTMTSTRFIGPATALRSATTDIDVVASTAPTTGQVLTATDSTHATWQDPTGGGSGGDVLSNRWAVPSSPHANDVEFDSATLPSAWKLFRQSDNTDQTGSILSGVSMFGSAVATGTCRVQAGQASRPSWLLLQPHSAAVQQWIYAFPMTLGSSHVFRASMTTIMRLAGLIDNNESTILFGVYAQSSSKPSQTSKLEIGYEADSHVMNIEAMQGASSLGTLSDIASTALPMDEVFILISSGQVYMFVGNRGQSILVGEVPLATAGFTAGDTVWVGFRFMDSGSSRTFSTIFGVDYYRQTDNAAAFLG